MLLVERCFYGRISIVTNALSEDAPLISIVLPMDGDPRGDPAHLKSWSLQTGLEPDDFEVLVGCCSASDALMEEMRSHLRPQDSVFRMDAGKTRRTVSEMIIYSEGAQRARGRYLFFSEDHVVAEPGCLAAVRKHILDHPDAPGFFLGCGHMGHEPLAVYEGLLYDKTLPLWQSPDCRDKVRIRATVLRRDVYEAVGGMPHQYGLCGETILSARLFNAGHVIGYLPEARVRHRNTDTMRLMIEHVGDHVAGECRFHDESDEDATANALATSETLVTRDFLHRSTARRVADALQRAIARTPDPASCHSLRSFASKAALTGRLGGWPHAWLAWLRVRLAYARFFLASGDRESGIIEVEVFWNSIRQVTETRHCIKNASPAGWLGDGVQTHGTFSPAQMTRHRATGFHSLEKTFDGHDIRWSSAVSRLHLDIPRGNYHITLRTGGIRPDQQQMPLAFFWNDHLIEEENVRRRGDSITFKVDRKTFRKEAGQPQELMIVCEPLANTGDSRSLGLPVLGLDFQPRNAKAAASSDPVTVP
jgi:hypothetical protein